MGDTAWGQLRTNHLDGRFEAGRFVGRRVIYGADVRKDFFSVEGARNLKALTGGDPMEAEVKYSNKRITMRGDLHVLVTTNDVLHLAAGEDAGAWRRRLIIMETLAADPTQLVANLAETILATEGDGVFSKLLGGVLRAQAEFSAQGRLTLPEHFTFGGNGSVILMGDIGLWVSDRVTTGSSNFTTSELYRLYERWGGERWDTPVNESIFARRLPELLEIRGINASHSISRDGRQVNGYRGLEVQA